MMIRNDTVLCRFSQTVARAAKLMLAGLICVVGLNSPSASAEPYAQFGPARQARDDWAARPFVRVNGCDQGEPCGGYDPGPYVHARQWEPEPAPYVHEERPVVRIQPDCEEERYAERARVVRQRPRERHSGEVYEEACGIKCWYNRLHAGYCGRGCDYYRFRMTEFREGKLGRDNVRVVCR
jgi:hypothetical protein